MKASPTAEGVQIHKLRIRLSRRGWILAAVGAVLVSSFAADAVASIGRIRGGVRVGELELGGLTSEEAETRLTERSREIAGGPATFIGPDDVEVDVKPEDVGFFPDVEATLDEAERIGRSGNILVRVWQRLRTYVFDTDIGWTTELDDDAATEVIDAWAQRFDNPSAEAGIRADGTRFEAVGPSEGRTLDRPAARRVLVAGLVSWPRRTLELPFEVKQSRTDLEDAQEAAVRAAELVRASISLQTPEDEAVELEPPDLAPLLEGVPVRRLGGWALDVRFSPERVDEMVGPRMEPFEREPRNARFTTSGASVSLVPSQDGLTFDAEPTAKAMDDVADQDAPRSTSAAFTAERPSMTTQDAEALGIKERVSTFTTTHSCCQPRVSNIHRFADIVDNTIVRPGAEFSLNNHVGKRTVERGFVLAPMIYDGEYKDDVGGGVSQFATTFFNAVFFGGYDVVTYKAHSYYISRYPAGREATISWPAPDLKFRNDSGAGILIRTAYTNTSITVSFYGDNGGVKVRSESGERTNFTEPEEQRKPNEELKPGEEKVVQDGDQGFDIVVWRVLEHPDGDTERERFFTRYKAEPRIIEFGPGTPEPTPKPPKTPEPAETPGQDPTAEPTG